MAERSGTAEQIISLPKGGGALKGIGEKFAPDLHTGTGNLTVPVDVPPGRNGFHPSLRLTYSTGTGNGPFGLGWTLSVPGVTRTTSRGLPTYDDEADTFLLSGAEDLVPVDRRPGVTRYRPRTEGLFARIEHHQPPDGGDYWEVWSPDGQVSLYGTPRPTRAEDGWQDPAVVADPADPGRVFAWKLSQTSDVFGNLIAYEYERDTGHDEDADGASAWVQTYLRRIRYVDHGDGEFLLSVVLDYEDRPDVLSDHRSTFEVRTRRRCRQIAVHSAAVPSAPLRTLRLGYDNRAANGASQLTSLLPEGHDGQRTETLPALAFWYTPFEPADRTFITVTGADLPLRSLADPALELVDLDGDGLPDILEAGGAMRWWRNLGGGAFDRPRQMRTAPAGVTLTDPGVQLLDADGDGRMDLLVNNATLSGYFPLGSGGEWDAHSFHAYEAAPSFALDDPEVRLVDLDGDGVTDAVRSGTRLECFFNDPRRGWQATRSVERGRHPHFPDVSFADPRVRLADMTGDGLQDIVLVHNGRTEYWPSLGRGSWSPLRVMRDSPRFPEGYDPRRILVGDVDGDGAADVVYVDDDQVTLWVNRCGQGWSPPVQVKGTPRVTDLSAVRLVDLLGTGVAGLLWSADAAQAGQPRLFFLDFTGGVKPGVLSELDNHLGALTRVSYAPSTRFALADARQPSTRWTTTLPFPVQVVAAVETVDQISGNRLTSEYRYHDGHWDGAEREFRGFGRVDQRDTQELSGGGASPPLETRTWFHQGPVGPEFGDWVEHDPAGQYWPGDRPVLTRPPRVAALLDALPRRARRDAVRALRGTVLRTELYELDGGGRQDRPVTVTETLTGLREESPPAPGDTDRRRVFFAHPLGTRTTQWERGEDPMTQLAFTDDHDAYGHPRAQTAVAVPRGRDVRADAPGEPCLATQTVTTYAHRDDEQAYLLGRVAQVTGYELTDQRRHGVLSLHAAALRGEVPRRVISQTLNFYDGAAFEGLPFGRLGQHGVLSRSERLVLTEETVAAAYGADRPPYLVPEDRPAWTGRYPRQFRELLPPLAGYRFQPGGDGSPHARGHFTVSGSRHDVQGGPDAGRGRGLLVATRDALGAETTVAYDGLGLLPTTVTDGAGLVTRAAYDDRTLQPREVTDPNGNRTAYGYTPLGLLERVAVMGKPGEAAGDTLQTPGTRLTYDLHAFAERAQPVSVRTTRRVHHAGDPDAPPADRDQTIEHVEFSDGFGRLLQTRTQAEDVTFGDPVSGDLSLPADPSGAAADVAGRERPAGDLPRVVVSGWQTYDNKGRVVEKYEPFFATGFAYAPPTDAQLGHKTTLVYDPRGRVVRTINPDGSQQRVVHGVPGDLADPDRFTPTAWQAFTYDANDNAGRTHPTAAAGYRDHWDTPSSVLVDALGRTVEAVARNSADRSGWHVTTSAYDIQGNLLTLTDELGRVAFRHVYDLAGRVLRTDQLDAGTSMVVLDAAGAPVETRDRRGAGTLHAYDAAHRPVRVWAADAAGEPVSLRQVIVYGDQPDAGLAPEQAAAANLLGVPVRHYDEAGLVTVERRDFAGNVLETVRQVVSDQQLLSVYEPAAAAGDWRVRPWQVDWQPPDGVGLGDHAAALLDPAEYRTTSSFDALGRVRTLRYPRDVEGRRAELRPRYNRAGALERVELDGVAFADHVAYDAKGRRTLVVHGNGLLTRLAYDPLTGRLARLRTDRSTRTAPRTYRVSGAPLQDLTYTYDLAGNLLTLTDRTPGSGVPGNPDAAQIADRALARLVAAGDALIRRFTYDPRYRLTAATGREHDLPGPAAPWADAPGGTDVTRTRRYTQQYTYDPAGNLTRLRHQADPGQATRAYDLAPGTNRLAALTVGQTVFGYGYDAAGNLTAEGESRHLEWDAASRLRVFRTQTGTAEPSVHAQYLYDAAGQRVRKLVRKQGGQVESTTYVGGVFEHHRHVQGATVQERSTLHVMDGQTRVALVRVGPPAPGDATPAVTYQLGDHLGSASLTTDDAGGEVSREEYTPYGETSFGGHARKRYRFTGKERDEESSLSYHGARYYAPWLARWTACDPAGPASVPNLYAYCRGNPVAYSDPTGTQEEPSVRNRAIGGLRMLGGAVQMLSGAALVTQVEVPVFAQVAGAVAFAHGWDDLLAGGAQLFTGQAQRNLTEQGVSAGAQLLGARHETADRIATGVDVALGFVGPPRPPANPSGALALAGGGAAMATARPLHVPLGVNAAAHLPEATRQLTMMSSSGGAAPPPAPPTPPRGGRRGPEIPYRIDVGEVKSSNVSVQETISYLGRFIGNWKSGIIDLRGIQASLRYTPDHKVLVDLFEIGGFERQIGGTYTLQMNRALANRVTAGLKFGGTDGAYGRVIEPLVLARVGKATGQRVITKDGLANGVDFLPLQLNFRGFGF